MSQRNYPFLAFFVVIPLLIILFALSQAGSTTLRCQRLEPHQVDCHLLASGWLGLRTISELELNNVQAAIIHTYSCEKKVTRDGTETRVPSTCEELAIVSSSGESYPGFSVSYVDAINNFLQSQALTWSAEESRWVAMIGFFAFAALWFAVGWWMTGGRGMERET